MIRVRFVHWDASQAAGHAAKLRGAGFDVTCFSDSHAAPTALLDDPPDVYVIDLRRIPSQGREVGAWLRRRKATRRIPLVFVEGDPVKTERVRALLPDATFSPWRSIVAAVNAASAGSVDDLVVPGTMDAYAGVSLARKLGIGVGTALALIEAPDGFLDLLGALPDRASVVRDRADAADTILLFADSLRALERAFDGAVARLAEGGRLWLAWPKKRSGIASDLTQAVVRAYGLDRGLVDYKIASIDRIWSGLCFARRVRSEP